LISLVRRFNAAVRAAVCGGSSNLLNLLMRRLCGGLRWCVPHTPYRPAPPLWVGALAILAKGLRWDASHD
jgi:hypothetical protein